MTTQNDKEKLLHVLHAHGQRFLSAFGIPATQRYETDNSDGSESEDEWMGFGSLDTPEASYSERNGEQENDDLSTNSIRTPDITIFPESTRSRPAASVRFKELRKSFMSSKVSNVTSSFAQSASEETIPDVESDDERTNTQNDVLLHRLVHTSLLSGSLNPELELDHSQRRRALAGRVLELAGKAKLSKGESVFRQEQHNKAARRVRDGLARKKMEQEKKALEEAKDLGNYHPTLKRLYDSSPSSTSKRKRTRGLGMGVGKYVDGTLKLSREEIASITGSRTVIRRRSSRK